MEIKDIRKHNINLLAGKYGRTAIADKLGYPDNNYVNQLCGGHTNIGSRTARKIEAAFGLATGWMDYPQKEDEARELPDALRATPIPDEVAELIQLIEETARAGTLSPEYAKLLSQQIRMMTHQ